MERTRKWFTHTHTYTHKHTHIHQTKIVTVMSHFTASRINKNYLSIIVKHPCLSRALQYPDRGDTTFQGVCNQEKPSSDYPAYLAVRRDLNQSFLEFFRRGKTVL